MDKSNNSGQGSSHSNINNTQTQQKYQNSNIYRNRQKVERELPYKDLRELLNHKRQNVDNKSGGPPSDPKYNYLSDPTRDGDTNTNNGRFPNQRFNSRNPSRGRGRGNFTSENTYYQKPGYSNEPNKFAREWDQGKEDPRNRRYKTHQHQTEGPSNYYNDPSDFRAPRYHDTKPINPNYKGPAHKYNPNYRGGNHRGFPPYSRRHQHYQHLDPVNISVEYNVEDGFRKCTTLDVKLGKTWNKNKKFSQPTVQSKDDVEENWDDDVDTSADAKIGLEIEETSEKGQDEVGDVATQPIKVGGGDASTSGNRRNDANKNTSKLRKVGGGDASTSTYRRANKNTSKPQKNKDEITSLTDAKTGKTNEEMRKNEAEENKDVPKPIKVEEGGRKTNEDTSKPLKNKGDGTSSADVKTGITNEEMRKNEAKENKGVPKPIKVEEVDRKTNEDTSKPLKNKETSSIDAKTDKTNEVEGNKDVPNPIKVEEGARKTNEDTSKPLKNEGDEATASADAKIVVVNEEMQKNEQDKVENVVDEAKDLPKPIKVEEVVKIDETTEVSSKNKQSEVEDEEERKQDVQPNKNE